MSEQPLKPTLEDRVGLIRDMFDVRKAYAERHHWPDIYFEVHTHNKAHQIFVEWLMSTEYDVYWRDYEKTRRIYALTMDQLYEWGKLKLAARGLYAVRKGTPDATEKIRIVDDLLSL